MLPKAESAGDLDRLASDLLLAFTDRDQPALDRVIAQYPRSFTFDDWWAEIWRRVYAFRQRSSKVPKNFLQLDEAQMLIAQDVGFGSWAALTDAVATGARPVPSHSIDREQNAISPSRTLTAAEWDDLLAVAKEQGITALHAAGLMTDTVIARVAEQDQVTSLTLGGSRELSDDGLQQLAKMPQLTHLGLSEYPGGKLTDRG